ncbi:parathion hydrolase [Mycobacterium tuberculosis]|uniref:Parathion hydrolase n=4 Tax=Mycobacterium tuberculosis TaxID=1773 RepID=A0A655DCC5_MYCTX|nr:parathion hydrolase [Mycobacterium tuberculosis]CKR15639.1 parathion hydrolase [Mycobacterium tuberculosis]CKR58722.1 parathion hydrolase [Mycobacterium tuberculosis]CKS53440.1 parathion hydrolase [Mycobacterium tuberculosis]CKS73406.1 parathion hydrolase [Mycobacterium tuberculosis]
MRSRPTKSRKSEYQIRSWSSCLSRAFPLDSKKSTVAAMISPERRSGYLRVKWLGLSSIRIGSRAVRSTTRVTLLHCGPARHRLRPSISDVPELNTARGPIDTADLGVTLMHEHVFIMTTEIAQNYPEAWGDEDKRVAGAIARLGELKARGVDTIVDLTVIGLGRYIPRIARVAAATELNIVVATGLYTYNDVPFYFHYLGPGAQLDGPEIMTDMFVRDIEHGIADTGIKAGILKCATDEPGLTPGVERVLRAVAQAHKRTGAPISTHTHAGLRRGLDQQRIFAEEGVDLSRVVIGHCGDSTDVGYLEELIAAGSYLGMDRFGVDVISPFQDRVNIVARMCERGHADKMVLSHDACCYFDALPEELVPVAMPNWHYLHIHNDVIPALKQHGVTDEQLHTMLVDNPRRIFERQGGYQ